jgi:hypothetical protein
MIEPLIYGSGINIDTDKWTDFSKSYNSYDKNYTDNLMLLYGIFSLDDYILSTKRQFVRFYENLLNNSVIKPIIELSEIINSFRTSFKNPDNLVLSENIATLYESYKKLNEIFIKNNEFYSEINTKFNNSNYESINNLDNINSQHESLKQKFNEFKKKITEIYNKFLILFNEINEEKQNNKNNFNLNKLINNSYSNIKYTFTSIEDNNVENMKNLQRLFTITHNPENEREEFKIYNLVNNLDYLNKKIHYLSIIKIEDLKKTKELRQRLLNFYLKICDLIDIFGILRTSLTDINTIIKFIITNFNYDKVKGQVSTIIKEINDAFNVFNGSDYAENVNKIWRMVQQLSVNSYRDNLIKGNDFLNFSLINSLDSLSKIINNPSLNSDKNINLNKNISTLSVSFIKLNNYLKSIIYYFENLTMTNDNNDNNNNSSIVLTVKKRRSKNNDMENEIYHYY